MFTCYFFNFIFIILFLFLCIIVEGIWKKCGSWQMLFFWLPGHLHFLIIFLMYIDKFICRQLFSCCTLIYHQLCLGLINLLRLELLVILLLWKKFLFFYQDLKFISLSLSSTIVSWCACICFFLLPWLDAIFYIYNFIILGNSSTI